MKCTRSNPPTQMSYKEAIQLDKIEEGKQLQKPFEIELQ